MFPFRQKSERFLILKGAEQRMVNNVQGVSKRALQL
jgi:hypothetical protein